jgi:hypothetical protein
VPPSGFADDPRVKCPPGTTQRRAVLPFTLGLLVECIDAQEYKHGPLREWWPTGRRMAELQLVHGELDGVARGWSEEGRLLGEEQAFDEKGRPVPVKDPRTIFPFL